MEDSRKTNNMAYYPLTAFERERVLARMNSYADPTPANSSPLTIVASS